MFYLVVAQSTSGSDSEMENNDDLNDEKPNRDSKRSTNIQPTTTKQKDQVSTSEDDSFDIEQQLAMEHYYKNLSLKKQKCQIYPKRTENKTESISAETVLLYEGILNFY